MMDRSSNAPLSPSEFASLRRLRSDPSREIPDGHRHVLLSMGLVAVAGDDLILTEAGSQRLEHEERGKAYREDPRSQASS
jgi:hypothetical protein